MLFKYLIKLSCLIMLLVVTHSAVGQKHGKYDAIYTGIPWFDQFGKPVSAHAGSMVKSGSKYYLFGEAHTDSSNAFAGFNCYSSSDLYNWKFESIALPVQANGKLAANQVGERVKVMKCPKTGEYVMYMHTDSLGYTKPAVGYATSKSVTGPYVFKGELLFNGAPIKKWDMGTFQDKDGSGYVLVHGGHIYKLSDDYKSISGQVLKDMSPECESPAMFRKGNTYYWLSSHRTSWERNDNFYYTANSLGGPWTYRGEFAPKGTLTWNSQTTFVFPVEGLKDTTYVFMGDRWSFPKQNSAATYVWQPLTVSGNSLSIPNYYEAWQIDPVTGSNMRKTAGVTIIDHANLKQVSYRGAWQQATISDTFRVSSTDNQNASFSIKFTGRQIGLYFLSKPDNGYARIVLHDSKGRTMLNSVVDMYCKYPILELKYITPVMAKEIYTLTVSVMNERPNWSDKRKNTYGSTGNFVSFNKAVIKD
jgi:hypothetical protein